MSPVISKDDDPINWQRWVDFFAYIGAKASVGMMTTGNRHSWTVPTTDPGDFEPVTAMLAVEAGDRERASRRTRTLTPYDRAAIVARLRPFSPIGKVAVPGLDEKPKPMPRFRRDDPRPDGLAATILGRVVGEDDPRMPLAKSPDATES